MDLVNLFNGPIGVWILVGILVLVTWARSASKTQSQREELSALRDLVSRELGERLVTPLRTPSKAKPSCATCRHWDHEEGQAQLRAHPAFFQASQFVTPAMMTRRSELVADDGTPKLAEAEDDGPTIPFKASWADVGACTEKNEGTFKDFVCEHYEARS